VLDGEIIVPNDKGVSDFNALQAELSAKRQERLIYYVFDLLYLDGFDLRGSPLIDRKRLLAKLLAQQDTGHVVYSEHLVGDGAAMFKQAVAMKLEGVVSKRVDAAYRSGRTEAWFKIKRVDRERFVIIGYVPEAGGSIAALRLARRDGEQLEY